MTVVGLSQQGRHVRMSATVPLPRMVEPEMHCTHWKARPSGLMTVWNSPSGASTTQGRRAGRVMNDDDALAARYRALDLKEVAQPNKGQHRTAQVAPVMALLAGELDALLDHVQRDHEDRLPDLDLEAVDDGQGEGSRTLTVVPSPSRLAMDAATQRCDVALDNIHANAAPPTGW